MYNAGIDSYMCNCTCWLELILMPERFKAKMVKQTKEIYLHMYNVLYFKFILVVYYVIKNF